MSQLSDRRSTMLRRWLSSATAAVSVVTSLGVVGQHTPPGRRSSSKRPRRAIGAPTRRTATRLTAVTVAIAALLVTAGVVPSSLVTPALAAVPTPTATTAIVNVNVGGDRLTIGTGATSVAPLAGVTLGLFTAQTGGTQIGTCVSDAQGDCSFIVSAPNLGTRPWVRGISSPAGWALNDPVRIGGNASSTTITPYAFQTPTLVANNTYETGNSYGGVNFMGSANITSFATQSSGIWQLRRDNPPLPQAKCGLDIALVLDMSGSLVGTQFTSMIGAANTIVDAMVGTPTRIATFSYGTRSPHNPPVTNFPALTSVQTQAGANTVKAQYATGTASGGTNWDEAFWNVAQAAPHYDLVINLTDGNPTVHSTGLGDDLDNDFIDLEYAAFSANAIKAEGTRIVGVGVGGAISTPQNLIATSGPIAGSDFFQTSDYPAAAAEIVALASAGCPSIEVQKSFPDGRIAASDQVVLRTTTGTTQVGTTGTTAGTEIGVQNQSTAETAGPVRATTGTSYTITETMAAGSTSTLAAYSSTWQCVVGTTVVASGTGSTGTFTFPDLSAANPNKVLCTFSNTRPQVSVSVTKAWVVDGVSYANGAQPAGLSAQLQLTGPGAAGASNQDWGVPRTGYALGSTATISETVQLSSAWESCVNTATLTQLNGTSTNVALPAAGYVATLSQPVTTAQITNTVICDQNPALALEKSAAVVDVDGDGVTGLGDHIMYSFVVTNTGDVTVSNIAITDDLLSAQGPPITTTCTPATIAPTQQSACVANAPYVITQADVDAKKVVNIATATGKDPKGGPVVSNPDDTLTPIELFRIPLKIEKIGEDVTGNWTRMDGSSWAILANVAAGAPGTQDDEPGTAIAMTITDDGNGYFEIASIPSGVYWLSELTAPDGFNLLAQAVQFTVNPDRTVSITANDGEAVTADGQLITVRDVPALVMPATGGTGAIPYLIGGASLIALSVGLMLFVRRRNGRPEVHHNDS